jgi:cellulose synthase/poly-beta-1,6-N-acetylglucosamine synthase-like glycosyltransferase
LLGTSNLKQLKCKEAFPFQGRLQVLDDSTDAVTAALVDDAVDAWKRSGVNMVRLRRTNRRGYKAGALKEGMLHLGGYEFVAIFDADFTPDEDFLVRKRMSLGVQNQQRHAIYLKIMMQTREFILSFAC